MGREGEMDRSPPAREGKGEEWLGNGEPIIADPILEKRGTDDMMEKEKSG